MGRAHALQARSVDVQDPRAMETRRDASAAIVGAATRWYRDTQPAIGRFDDEGPISPLDLLTVSTTIVSNQGVDWKLMYNTMFIELAWHISLVSLNLCRVHRVVLIFMIVCIRTILKLQSFHAYPALATNGSIVEPYATDCLDSARAITTLSCRATGSFDTTAPSVSPIFIWCCWIAARVFFGMFSSSTTMPAATEPFARTVNSCLGAQINIEPEFKVILGSMKSMAAHWQLAGKFACLA